MAAAALYMSIRGDWKGPMRSVRLGPSRTRASPTTARPAPPCRRTSGPACRQTRSSPIRRFYALTLSDGSPSIGGDEKALGDLAPYVTYGNAHIYGANGQNVWTNDMPYWLPIQSTPTPGMPMVISETGYQTTDVSEDVAAKYVLNLLFHNSMAGIVSTYIYDLSDAPSGDPQRYGLFNADWTPKAAATALHNLTTILGGAGPGPLPGSLTYSLTGLPFDPDLRFFLGGDQAFSLAVWNEATILGQPSSNTESRRTREHRLDRPRRYPTYCVSVYDPIAGAAPSRNVGARQFRSNHAHRSPGHRRGHPVT